VLQLLWQQQYIAREKAACSAGSLDLPLLHNTNLRSSSTVQPKHQKQSSSSSSTTEDSSSSGQQTSLQSR
jgi:hypothetical protein